MRPDVPCHILPLRKRSTRGISSSVDSGSGSDLQRRGGETRQARLAPLLMVLSHMHARQITREGRGGQILLSWRRTGSGCDTAVHSERTQTAFATGSRACLSS